MKKRLLALLLATATLLPAAVSSRPVLLPGESRTMCLESLSVPSITNVILEKNISNHDELQTLVSKVINPHDRSSFPPLWRLLFPFAVLGTLYIVVKKQKLDIPAMRVSH